MKAMGHTVFWSIADDVLLTPEQLKAAGFENETPRNEPKTALIKALKVVKKAWEIKDEDIGATMNTPETLKKGDHKRFEDGIDLVRIALTRPKIDADGGYSTETALVVNLDRSDRSSPKLTFENKALPIDEFHDLETRIRQAYEEARLTIDATQFRLLVARKVTGYCKAISLRAFSGGIYLVAPKNTDRLMRVKGLFAGLDKKKAVFEAFPVYDDGSEVAESLTYHTTVAVEKEIAGFIANLNAETKKGITKRALETRIESADEIKAKIADYEDHLKKRAEEFVARTQRLMSLLEVRLADAKSKAIEPFDLLAELDAVEASIAKARSYR